MTFVATGSIPQVKLDVFEGPLDLLLYLIRKNDLTIYDIPISQITSEYLHVLDVMKDLNLSVAGEFLVMAATLMQIKARMLLPAAAHDTEEALDPRADLVHRLLEYQRFKEVSKVLDSRLATSKDVHYRGTTLLSEGDYQMEVSLFDLLDAFRDVLKNLSPKVREIQTEDVPIEIKIKEVLAFLDERPYATFREILQRETSRRGLIGTFLAVLELIRLRRIAARQGEQFGDIRVYRTETLPEHLSEVPVTVEHEPSVESLDRNLLEPAPTTIGTEPTSGGDHGTIGTN